MMGFMVARVNSTSATFTWRVNLNPSSYILPLSMFVLGMLLLGAPIIWLFLEMLRGTFRTH